MNKNLIKNALRLALGYVMQQNTKVVSGAYVSADNKSLANLEKLLFDAITEIEK